MIFLAAGAFITAGLLLVFPSSPLWGQMLLFSVSSLFSMAFFRKPLMKHLGWDKSSPSRDEIVNETATPREDILPNTYGKAELRGTVWNARNGGSTVLAKGKPCRVSRVEGLTLWLDSEG